MTSDVPDYQLRGHRVPPFSPNQIKFITDRVCKIFKLNKQRFRPGRVEQLISSLEEVGINVDPVADDEWIEFTRATMDPQTLMIYMPEKLYHQLCRGKAEAIRIFLHELGHIFLCHRPSLHFSDEKPTIECDSEWQADLFADLIINRLQLPKEDYQLELMV